VERLHGDQFQKPQQPAQIFSTEREFTLWSGIRMNEEHLIVGRSWPRGIYILKVRTEAGVAIHRMIKR